MKQAQHNQPARAGFTLIEMAIGTGMLLFLTGALVTSLSGIRNLTAATGDKAQLQTMGDRALLAVVSDLRSSGAISASGKAYPYVFDDGAPAPIFAPHEHEAARENAEAGDPDFGPNREIVFLVPADLDEDRRPDVNAAGELEWSVDEVSFVVNTRADGINYLEQRTNAGDPQVIARHVERVVFDDAESSGFQIPLGTVRARLFFRIIDGQGNLIRYRTEAVVNLRNG